MRRRAQEQGRPWAPTVDPVSHSLRKQICTARGLNLDKLADLEQEDIRFVHKMLVRSSARYITKEIVVSQETNGTMDISEGVDADGNKGFYVRMETTPATRISASRRRSSRRRPSSKTSPWKVGSRAWRV